MKKVRLAIITIGLSLMALMIVWMTSATRSVNAAPTARPLHAPGDCTVTNTNDSGPGSLRECMLGLQPGATITFSPSVFPLASPATITVASALPVIVTDSITIDGSNAGVILRGGERPAVFRRWLDD